MSYSKEERERCERDLQLLAEEVMSAGSRVEQLAALSQLSVARALLLQCSQREQQATE